MKKVLWKKILVSQIWIRKKEMYASSKNFGFTHPKVVAHSQRVDVLINRYQRTYSDFG